MAEPTEKIPNLIHALSADEVMQIIRGTNTFYFNLTNENRLSQKERKKFTIYYEALSMLIDLILFQDSKTSWEVQDKNKKEKLADGPH